MGGVELGVRVTFGVWWRGRSGERGEARVVPVYL